MTGTPLAFADILNPGTMLVLGVIAILLFGERLPETARSFGQKFVQFKKGIQNIQDELRAATNSVTSAISSGPSDSYSSYSSASTDSVAASGGGAAYDDSDRDMVAAPKFVPPKTEPGSANDEI